MKVGMRWLDSVHFDQLHPAMGLAAVRVADIFQTLGTEGWITSANDRQHKVGSLHYLGKALDFRIHTLSEAQKPVLLEYVQKALGTDFFCQLEDVGSLNEHLHVQWQR